MPQVVESSRGKTLLAIGNYKVFFTINGIDLLSAIKLPGLIMNIREALRKWDLENSIKHRALNELLGILTLRCNTEGQKMVWISDLRLVLITAKCEKRNFARDCNSQEIICLFPLQRISLFKLVNVATFDISPNPIICPNINKLYTILFIWNKRDNSNNKDNMDRDAKTVYLLGLLYILRKRRRPRRWWVRQIFMERKNQGAYHNLLQEMRLSDKEKYFNYLRMSHDQFLELLRLIGPVIEKLDIRREPIAPAERLAATLRYLASGDSMVSISYSFRLGKTTVSNVINETCKALWNVLKDKVFFELTERYWQEVSKDFEDLWQLPHCIGAIDGKHVIMQAPPNCGSQFFNYKGSHSIVLLALCDAKYRFITVDFGAQGRQSDGGVFRYSDIGQCLLNDKLNLPPASPLEIGSEPMQYYVAGDSAFPLTEHLMHPYSGKFLAQYQRIFNYRLSRGRRVSENAFGILASRWRILRKPIIASTDTVESIVGAIVTLHNWIINQGSGQYCSTTFVDREDPNGDVINGEWRLEPLENNLQRLSRTGTNNYKKVVEKMRDDLALYFFTEGALPFQWNK